tara:strand:+ start:8214 stop:8549 length:336 start_codon:yes stop_codon:yes gene_type:complete
MSDNVFPIAPRPGVSRDNGGDSGHTGGGNPPSGDDMERRMQLLEAAIPDIREKLTRSEAKLDSIDKHGATKADLASTESTLIKWYVGTAFALVGLASAMAFGVARLLSITP